MYGSFALSGYAGAALRLAGGFREQAAQLTANGGGGCVDDLRQISQLRQGFAGQQAFAGRQHGEQVAQAALHGAGAQTGHVAGLALLLGHDGVHEQQTVALVPPQLGAGAHGGQRYGGFAVGIAAECGDAGDVARPGQAESAPASLRPRAIAAPGCQRP